MFNIDLNEAELENLITVLEKNNQEIVDNLDYVYNLMTQIDDSEWHSTEKEKINNVFIPYIKRQKDRFNSNLMARTDLLKDALSKYRQQNNKIEKATENLEVL